MFALPIGGADGARRLRKERHPFGMSYLVLIFVVSALLGAFPVSDVLADADIDVPMAQFIDSGDAGLDEPEENEDEKYVLNAVSSTAEFRRVSWTCSDTQAFQPLFSSGAFSLPPATAPPGALL